MKRDFSKLANDRGVTAVIVALMFVLILSLAALAVDVGYMMMAKNQLQNAADAAALAGARKLGQLYQAMNAVDRQGGLDSCSGCAGNSALVKSVTKSAALANKAAGENVVLADGDIRIGAYPPNPVDETVVPQRAVQVTAHRDDTNAKGPITTFFARVFGKNIVKISAVATAKLTPVSTGHPRVPFAISENYLPSGCNHAISWGGSGTYACAAWTTFTHDSPSGSDQTYIKELIKGTRSIPNMHIGEKYYIINGAGGGIFKDLKDLWDEMKDGHYENGDADQNPNTWTTKIAVYKFDCTTSSIKGSYELRGYLTLTISNVTTAGGGVVDATTDCTVDDDPGGGGAGNLGGIPTLVQ
jgi:Flp pilus assembly protein TadG